MLTPRELKEFTIPDKFKTAGEKLELESETLQQRLNEKRDALDEDGQEDTPTPDSDDPDSEWDEVSPSTEKTQEELEIEIIETMKEKGDVAKTFTMNDPEIPNSFEFIEVDNDYFDMDCGLALEGGKTRKIREQCLVYCHKYNLWYFSDSIFPDVAKMGRIFGKIKRFLVDDLEMDAKEIPEEVDMNENDMFKGKMEGMELFNRFNYYFAGEGIRRRALVEWET